MPSTPLHHVWEYTDTDRSFWQEHLEDWVPQTIFDAHTHIHEPEYRLHPMTDEMRKQYWVNELFEPIGAQVAQHCYRTVFPNRDFSCLAFGMPSLDFDIEAGNKRLSEEVRSRGWNCLALVRPQWSAEKLEEELDRPGVAGVKPYYALISYTPSSRDEHLEASIFDFLPHHQLEVLNSRHAWVTLHVPRSTRLGDPQNLAEVRAIRERYSNVKLVIAHLGRSYTLPHAKEALPLLADDPGLFFDTSAVLNPEVLHFALETIGPEQIIYGTDNPIFYMRGRRRWQGKTYQNHTNYPFYFNQQRESPEIEAKYTLYMYEALKAFKQACLNIALDRKYIEQMFCGNAKALLASSNHEHVV